MPYVVRHLSSKIDKSREKTREDKLTFEEFERMVIFFSDNPMMQFFLTGSLESIGRPQEILWRKLKNVELFKDYAKINITEHGKEGCGILQCIDSFPYLLKWLNVHPYRNDKNAFLFIDQKKKNGCKSLTPKKMNELIKIACKALKIDKPITCYSLKRNGVTFRKMRGDSHFEIQHAARWSSTRQLKTYDLSTQEDALINELQKRGIVKTENKYKFDLRAKMCSNCNTKAGFTEELCPKCQRPLQTGEIQNQIKQNEDIQENLKQELESLKSQLELRKPYEEEMSKFLSMPEARKLYEMMIKMKTEIENLKGSGKNQNQIPFSESPV